MKMNYSDFFQTSIHESVPTSSNQDKSVSGGATDCELEFIDPDNSCVPVGTATGTGACTEAGPCNRAGGCTGTGPCIRTGGCTEAGGWTGVAVIVDLTSAGD